MLNLLMLLLRVGDFIIFCYNLLHGTELLCYALAAFIGI